MGQKANPIGNRLGIIRGWESNWYGGKKDFATKLIEDNKIRNYLNARINKGGISNGSHVICINVNIRKSRNKLTYLSFQIGAYSLLFPGGQASLNSGGSHALPKVRVGANRALLRGALGRDDSHVPVPLEQRSGCLSRQRLPKAGPI